MVKFNSRVPGTPAELWNADARWTTLPPIPLAGVSELVVVAAHADDETLGAGGLIAESAKRGIPVRVVIVTDGSRSHPDSPTVGPARLAALRHEEAVTAVRVLDHTAVIEFLDFADGQVPQLRAEVSAALADRVGAAAASTLLVAPWRGDGHGDHRVVAEICAGLAGVRQLIEYPIWLWNWASPLSDAVPWNRLGRVPLSSSAVAAKSDALARYRTQIAPLSPAKGDEAALDPRFLQNFDRDSEIFVRSDRHSSDQHSSNQHSSDQHGSGFDSRWHEQRNRALTIGSLPKNRYATALEIGCSIGVLTEALADRCDTLYAVDVSPVAVDRARKRLAGRSNVLVAQADLSADFPTGPFDLVVLSEVGYHLGTADLERLFDRIEANLTADGTLLLCHRRHPVADYPISSDDVHALHLLRTRLRRVVHHVEADFVLDVFTRDSRSVAELTGLHS
jgi:LmbE family N-acetylglucosaminyl deacetylase/2-polyprenyl-3-methyl-5-hydroxy-6-metoxy-1,4-benzoquinol methylase